MVERITPWLLDLGSWVFGALIAFILVILGALRHMAWWIGGLLVVMAVVSQVIVFGALGSTGSETRWRSPAGDVEPKDS